MLKQRTSKVWLVFSWLLVAAVMVLIFYMSAKTGNDLDNNAGIISMIKHLLVSITTGIFGHQVDVSLIGHFTEYFVLGLALVNALRLSFPLKKAAAWAVVFASIYGVTDELHQIFVPQRACDPVDWLVDTLAAGIAVLIFVGVATLRKRRTAKSF